ncbi:hypothetical protein VTN00DRAFT_10290 [Thermoascus crustaceus]|uniref:uncharacterized protein n=1 Tax=Thermoascus crustaceus TaxID=5088 RepID=UPI003742A9C2
MPINLYRILYTTVFAFLSFVLLCLILLTPGDAIYQCYKNHKLTNIFIITGAYIITFLLAALIYASRIYTNRSVLAGIPKAWIPVEKADVGKSVRRLVVEGFARSAIIAYQARPRDTSGEEDGPLDYQMLMVDRERPPWGHISHPGWCSPSSPDLPNLQYQSVIQELPHLIEAKAVSLAPPDPHLSPSHHYHHHLDPYRPRSAAEEQSIPDPRVVEILQRPATMGMREYLGHLASLKLINPPRLGAEFLAIYERARFSSQPLHETEFRTLMGIFAEILRGMKAVDPQVLDEIRRSGSSYSPTGDESSSYIGPSDEEGETDTVSGSSHGDADDEALTRGRSNSVRPSLAHSSTWDSSRSVYTAPLWQNSSSPALSRYTTARRAGLAASRTPSMNSLRRVRSNVSGSSGESVIRLAEARTPLDLPYTIDLPGRRNHQQ